MVMIHYVLPKITTTITYIVTMIQGNPNRNRIIVMYTVCPMKETRALIFNQLIL